MFYLELLFVLSCIEKNFNTLVGIAKMKDLGAPPNGCFSIIQNVLKLVRIGSSNALHKQLVLKA